MRLASFVSRFDLIRIDKRRDKVALCIIYVNNEYICLD